jgi:hypothetical protein
MAREKEKIDDACEGCIMKSYDGVMGYDTRKVGGREMEDFKHQNILSFNHGCS